MHIMLKTQYFRAKFLFRSLLLLSTVVRKGRDIFFVLLSYRAINEKIR